MTIDYEEGKGEDYQNFGGDDNNEVPPEDDPYQGDDQTYQEHFRKTFITENQKKMGMNEQK